MKLMMDKIILYIATANGLEVMMGDICNTYLDADTQENIYTHSGPKF